MSLKRDLELLYEIGCLRFLQRVWKHFLSPAFQNIPEHTLRVMWIALLLAKYEKKGDEGKIVKMALVHDLSESRSGDVHYISRQYNIRQEEKAIKDVFEKTALEKEFVALWEEYESRKSIEAKIVKDADNLDVDLELKEQEYRGHKLGSSWKRMRKEATYKRLYTKAAKKMWRAIQASNPHDWHLKGRNRFLAGDWKEDKKK